MLPGGIINHYFFKLRLQWPVKLIKQSAGTRPIKTKVRSIIQQNEPIRVTIADMGHGRVDEHQKRAFNAANILECMYPNHSFALSLRSFQS